MTRYPYGTIDPEEAHIWWDVVGKRIEVVPIQSSQDRQAGGKDYTSNAGACYAHWKDMTDEQRVLEMTERVIEFVAIGMDPITVLREFAKVQQFLELGAASHTMCRALTLAMDGVGRSDPTAFRERYLSEAS